MANSPHLQPQHDWRDLNPRTNGPERSGLNESRSRRARTAAAALGAEGAGEVQTLRYLRPSGAAHHVVQSPTDRTFETEVPTTLPGTTFTPNQRVLVLHTRAGAVIAGHPPGAERGTSLEPVVNSPGDLEVFAIESISPESFDAGTTTAATITGSGFRSGDVLDAVVYDPTDAGADALGYVSDPDVTLSAITVDSSTQISATVAVANSLAAERGLTLRIERAA